MTDRKNFYDKPVKSDMRTYDNIRKIAIGQGDDYSTGCLLDYNYFNKHYKMIAIDLTKQPALDADLKATQQINFAGNLARPQGPTMFFIIEEAIENRFRFFEKNCESIVNSYYSDNISV